MHLLAECLDALDLMRECMAQGDQPLLEVVEILKHLGAQFGCLAHRIKQCPPVLLGLIGDFHKALLLLEDIIGNGGEAAVTIRCWSPL